LVNDLALSQEDTPQTHRTVQNQQKCEKNKKSISSQINVGLTLKISHVVEVYRPTVILLLYYSAILYLFSF